MSVLDLQQESSGHVLKDVNGKGKDRRWKYRKRQSVNLANAFMECWIDSMVELGFDRNEAKKMSEKYYDEDSIWYRKNDATDRCADTLEFVRTENGKLKLYRAWFCKDRLCPMCNWRRAMKFSMQIGQILQEMSKRDDVAGKPIFLTLSMLNVAGEDIGKSFSDYALSFQRLMKYKAVKTHCLGAIRSSEVTYNEERNDYNTHIHCLLWMKPSYFKGGAYISHERWVELWKKAARLDYSPSVDVRAVKPKKPSENDPTGIFAATLEVSKYPIKPDIFKRFTEVPKGESDESKELRAKCIKYLEMGMHGKRLISFFGIFKEIRAKLKQDDTEDGDLVNADGVDKPEHVLTVERYVYNRDTMNYHHVETASIKDEYNNDYHTKE